MEDQGQQQPSAANPTEQQQPAANPEVLHPDVQQPQRTPSITSPLSSGAEGDDDIVSGSKKEEGSTKAAREAFNYVKLLCGESMSNSMQLRKAGNFKVDADLQEARMIHQRILDNGHELTRRSDILLRKYTKESFKASLKKEHQEIIGQMVFERAALTQAVVDAGKTIPMTSDEQLAQAGQKLSFLANSGVPMGKISDHIKESLHCEIHTSGTTDYVQHLKDLRSKADSQLQERNTQVINMGDQLAAVKRATAALGIDPENPEAIETRVGEWRKIMDDQKKGHEGPKEKLGRASEG